MRRAITYRKDGEPRVSSATEERNAGKETAVSKMDVERKCMIIIVVLLYNTE